LALAGAPPLTPQNDIGIMAGSADAAPNVQIAASAKGE